MNVHVVKIDCEIPEGYIPIRYGAPVALDTYVNATGGIKTASHNMLDNYLIVKSLASAVDNIARKLEDMSDEELFSKLEKCRDIFHQKDVPGNLRKIAVVEEAKLLGEEAKKRMINLLSEG